MEQLTAFYEAIADDARIGTTHICLYLALCHERSNCAVEEVIEVSRHRIMKNARISRKTYHKCMKELQEYGYIRYEPSFDPFYKSKVFLNKL